MKKLISVIAPMYNEEALVEEYCNVTLNVLRNITDYSHEIIFVNDGSSDNTYQEMLRLQNQFPDEIGVICLSRNFGLEGAVEAGLRTTKADIAVVMDADLQDPPELIVEMLAKVEGGADIVTACRKKRGHDSLWKRFTASVYYKLLNLLSGKLKLERSAANYRMITRKALNVWLNLPESNGVFRVTVPFIGMKTETVEYERNKRAAGTTKYNFRSMLNYALNSFAGISVEPLTITLYALPLVFVVFTASLICMLITSHYWRAAWTVITFCSLLTIIMLIAICTTGIYVGQIMLEVKHRPASIIYEYIPALKTKEENNQ